MRLLTFLLFICFLPSCRTNNLLKWHYRPNYFETVALTSKSGPQLYQNVCYNRPGVIDEEHCFELSISFKDSTKAIAKKKLDVVKDTALVRTGFDLFSVWTWNIPQNPVSGTIEIRSWEKNKIVIKEDIQVYDSITMRHYRFKGIRKFEPKEGW